MAADQLQPLQPTHRQPRFTSTESPTAILSWAHTRAAKTQLPFFFRPEATEFWFPIVDIYILANVPRALLLNNSPEIRDEDF